jgi:hypothetical protein
VQTAQVLFWINLLPTATFLTLTILSFGADINIEAKAFLFQLLFIGCTIAEVIYFLQFNFKRYSNSKSLWLYSMVYNGILALVILIVVVTSQIWGLMYLIIYPNLFFYFSRMSYQKLSQS